MPSSFTPTEAKWTASMRDELEQCGAVVVPYVASAHASGWPDRIVWHPKWRGWIEFKGEKTQVAKRQKANIATLNRRRPGTAVIVRYPGICYDFNEVELFRFSNGRMLIEKLAELERLYDVPADPVQV